MKSKPTYQELEQENKILRQKLEISKQDKKKSKENEDKFNAVANASPDGIGISDLEGIIEFAAPQTIAMWGYTKEEFSGKLIYDVIHDNSHVRATNMINELLKGNNLGAIEYDMVRKDGSIFICEVNCSLLYDENNKPEKVLYIQRDITNRKKAEPKIHNQNQEYEAINEELRLTNIELQTSQSQNINSQLTATINALPDIVFETDSKGRIYNYYASNAELLYTKPEEFLNKKIDDILPKKAATICNNAIEEAIEKGKYSGAVYSLKLPHGIFWFELSIALKTDNNIPEKRVIMLVRDITDRKKAEQALKESEEKLKKAQQIAKIGHWELDIINNKLIWSDEIFRIFDLKPQEFDATYEAFLENIHPDDRNKVNEAYTNSLKNKLSYEIEHRLLLKSGETKYVIEKCNTEYNKKGEPISSIGTILDITERKKVEQALKESNKTKDKFFSIISHDLKSPFNSMLGFSKMLDEKFEKYDTEKKKKFINIINQGLQDTYKLLENLLTWSRSQRGSIDFKPEKLNLHLLAKETSGLLHQSTENKSIKLKNKIADNIYVDADKDMLSTIIRNLISNAIKFTQKGGDISINAKNKQQFIEISVKDNGIGISKEIQSKLFDIGENTSTQGTENETGTGLGLILCKEFVEKHGGKIWIKSEEEKGSEFVFIIPIFSN